jgi:hypothetical protein
MRDHSVEDIERVERYLKKKGYPFIKVSIEGREIGYYEVSREENPDLRYFVMRFSNNETKRYVMGVSTDVPQLLRPFFVLEEYIEFIEKGIDYKGRVIEAESEVLPLVPLPMRKDYISKRLSLFKKELELDEKQPEKYDLGDDGRQEFEANVMFLERELGSL